jgi:hypothetical protein
MQLILDNKLYNCNIIKFEISKIGGYNSLYAYSALQRNDITLNINFSDLDSINMIQDWFFKCHNSIEKSNKKTTIIKFNYGDWNEFSGIFPKSISVNNDNTSIDVEFSADNYKILEKSSIRDINLNKLLGNN